MKIKLKQATLLADTKEDFTVVLLIQRKDKSTIEVKFSEKATKGSSIFDTLGDWWHSVKVDEDVYDVNIYNEDRGLLKVSLYATKVVEGSEFLEAITHESTDAKLKMQ